MLSRLHEVSIRMPSCPCTVCFDVQDASRGLSTAYPEQQVQVPNARLSLCHVEQLLRVMMVCRLHLWGPQELPYPKQQPAELCLSPWASVPSTQRLPSPMRRGSQLPALSQSPLMWWGAGQFQQGCRAAWGPLRLYPQVEDPRRVLQAQQGQMWWAGRGLPLGLLTQDVLPRGILTAFVLHQRVLIATALSICSSNVPAPCPADNCHCV